MTTVACVLVKGHVGYTSIYVERLRAMVARHLRAPYRFVCLTDQPDSVPHGIESIPIPAAAPLKGWWAKVQLFNPANGLSGRVLYLDLDTLIVGPLEPIVEFDAPFALVPHAGTFNGKDGLAVVKRFNSSVMVWDAGMQDALFTAWQPTVASRLWGDQDWIGERSADGVTMPIEWFPRLSEVKDGPVPASARVVLAKKPKPEEAARQWSWVRDTWRAA